MTLIEWFTRHLDNDMDSGMRIGQSFMCRVYPKMDNHNLWNERNAKKAWRMIEEIEKDYQL